MQSKTTEYAVLLSSPNTMKPALLFIWLSVILAVISVVNSCPPIDRAALLDLKAGFEENNFGTFDSWTGDNCCLNWTGVSCDPSTLRVTELELRGENGKLDRSGYMTGSISSQICKLDQLTSLIVADWKAISGEIPSCISSLASLRFVDLSGNHLTGEIPADIGNVKRLVVLKLDDNAIIGGIPASIVQLSGLRQLDLRDNQLTGEIPLDFGKLGKLIRVLLSGNKLTGSIPSSIANIKTLQDLDLSSNQISGSIPTQLGDLPDLGTLYLGGNSLSGQIPPCLLSHKRLGLLNLSSNAIEGPIPDVFGPKSYFMILDLSNNKLSGPIPKSLSSADYIGHLDFSFNQLSGPIPAGSPFTTLDTSSFANNHNLCGQPLKKACS